MKSGVREFSCTGFKVVTGIEKILKSRTNINTLIGCTNHPAPGQKFCPEHQDHKSPVVTPDQMSKESLNLLNNQHSS